MIVQLNDDCAAPVTNGNVVASFSNGDAPLNLVGDSLGNYSTTWQPGGINTNMVVTLNATAGTLQPATAKLYGGIAPNQTPPPTIAPGGTLNNLNPVVGRTFSAGNHRASLWLRSLGLDRLYRRASAAHLSSTTPSRWSGPSKLRSIS